MLEIITDQNNEFGNYTTLSNIIDELDLSPLAIALYFHYKRWANARTKRPTNARELMKKYKTGSAKIARAKNELIRNDLIEIDRSGQPHGLPDKITILDITARNYEFFKAKKDAPCNQIVTRPVTKQLRDLLPDSYSTKEKGLKEKDLKLVSKNGGAGTRKPGKVEKTPAPPPLIEIKTIREKHFSEFREIARICFGFPPEKIHLLKPEDKRTEQIEKVLIEMRDSEMDFPRLYDFNLFWRGNWRSLDKKYNQYQPPRPEQITELWYEFLESEKLTEEKINASKNQDDFTPGDFSEFEFIEFGN